MLLRDRQPPNRRSSPNCFAISPPGLTKWALHPDLGTPELQTIESEGWSVRRADFDFAISTEARAIIEQEGIILFSYQPLQAVWQGK